MFAGAVAEAESGAGMQGGSDAAQDPRSSPGQRSPGQDGGAGGSPAADRDDDDVGGPLPPAQVQPPALFCLASTQTLMDESHGRWRSCYKFIASATELAVVQIYS